MNTFIRQQTTADKSNIQLITQKQTVDRNSLGNLQLKSKL